MSFTYKITKTDEITRSDGFIIQIVPGQVTPELKEYWAWQAERTRVAAVQHRMDDVARGFEFMNGIDSVASFVDSANKDYAAQAKKLLAWRDAVWAKFESIRGEDFSVEQVLRRLPEPPQL